ncbi:hypothetical protein G7074_16770 [Pedobacter sp. HDW13]|uniref:hypothetical protein n=1 Tax=unclassified Pedobacter TaxID=2628915 RepID=UPI000F5AC843|nr:MULTISPECIES: hypothetical protein [unclassified Pedobacter]QIL40770.1 hypothetical protein G7074_16770 [Pedobacter sp. HDW13]RQO71415.1 hypothetical protein DBR40_16550 [Pedobacter sp. KBW01]
MKITLYALLLSVVLFGCGVGNSEKTYKARPVAANDDFNVFPKSKKNVLTIVKTDSGALAYADRFAINYKDTTITIDDAPNAASKKFLSASFINTQKTAVLVQVANESGKKAPFYIIYLNDGNTEVVSLNKPSKGAEDKKYTNGLEELTRTSLLINNDYFINTVNSKVYPVKRQNDAERIQGKFFMYSSDKTTLVFLTKDALYQANVANGETFTLPLPASLIGEPETLVGNIQRDYTWVPSANGTPFLKKNADDNRIVDIKEFKH